MYRNRNRLSGGIVLEQIMALGGICVQKWADCKVVSVEDDGKLHSVCKIRARDVLVASAEISVATGNGAPFLGTSFSHPGKRGTLQTDV